MEPAEKPKQNISDDIPDSVIFPRVSDDLLSSLHLTREDLKLSLEDRMKKIVRGFKEEMDEDDSIDEIDEPEYSPEDTLPKGYDWASFCYGTGDKDFIVKMDCFICGVGLDHWPVDCPKKKEKVMTSEFKRNFNTCVKCYNCPPCLSIYLSIHDVIYLMIYQVWMLSASIQ
ncbi:PREDICTED: uncharacterized protein LOC101291880 [Fragaria vesca subsp. vesca]|uniref:uncharacterized protein LOC101314606 isoform X1 n=1 Tax=Fragaria vesca subsp. vesca TaxID=101020 RepID=UPI0002C32C31|nr:PREDICTED: uncharacterized protein LOC101314606 isoform X1 [Fragaria vesca subsp. vesca]